MITILADEGKGKIRNYQKFRKTFIVDTVITSEMKSNIIKEVLNA